MSCNLETNTVSQIASTDHQVTSLFAAHTSLLVLEEGFEPNEARKQQQTNKQTKDTRGLQALETQTFWLQTKHAKLYYV